MVVRVTKGGEAGSQKDFYLGEADMKWKRPA